MPVRTIRLENVKKFAKMLECQKRNGEQCGKRRTLQKAPCNLSSVSSQDKIYRHKNETM
jgi:hypothetical protein